MKKTTALVLACLLLACATSSWAGREEEGSPDAIRKELETLRIIYTDDHPDVQILKRRLDKAMRQKERQAQEKAQRQKQRQERYQQGPEAAAPAEAKPQVPAGEAKPQAAD